MKTLCILWLNLYWLCCESMSMFAQNFRHSDFAQRFFCSKSRLFSSIIYRNLVCKCLEKASLSVVGIIV